MKLIMLAGIVLLASTVALGQAERGVAALLDAQVAAWNRGDIEGFMAGYERSPEITFVSGDTISRGWQTVFDRYRSRYGSRDKMGTLTFSELEVTSLGADAALAQGRWQLERAADKPRGRFSLVLRRRGPRAGWRIIHDHTSAAQD